jgi:hypothetical protein
VVIELPNGVFMTMTPLAVDADAGAADHPELRGFLEYLRRHLGGRADGEPVEVTDDLGKLVLVLAEVRLEIDGDAVVLENLHGGGGKSVRDEYVGHGIFPLTVRRLLPSSSAKADDPVHVGARDRSKPLGLLDARLRGHDG